MASAYFLALALAACALAAHDRDAAVLQPADAHSVAATQSRNLLGAVPARFAQLDAALRNAAAAASSVSDSPTATDKNGVPIGVGDTVKFVFNGRKDMGMIGGVTPNGAISMLSLHLLGGEILNGIPSAVVWLKARAPIVTGDKEFDDKGSDGVTINVGDMVSVVSTGNPNRRDPGVVTGSHVKDAHVGFELTYIDGGKETDILAKRMKRVGPAYFGPAMSPKPVPSASASAKALIMPPASTAETGSDAAGKPISVGDDVEALIKGGGKRAAGKWRKGIVYRVYAGDDKTDRFAVATLDGTLETDLPSASIHLVSKGPVPNKGVDGMGKPLAVRDATGSALVRSGDVVLVVTPPASGATGKATYRSALVVDAKSDGVHAPLFTVVYAGSGGSGKEAGLTSSRLKHLGAPYQAPPSPSATTTPSAVAFPSPSTSPAVVPSLSPLPAPAACTPLADPAQWILNAQKLSPPADVLTSEYGLVSISGSSVDGTIVGTTATNAMYIYTPNAKEPSLPGLWAPLPGKMTRVAVADAGHIVGVGDGGEIYRLGTGTGGARVWAPLGTNRRAKSISIGADGETWIIALDSTLARWNAAAGKWSRIKGSAKHLSVGDASNIWAVTLTGGIVRYSSGSGGWQEVAGPAAKRIAVSRCGTRIVVQAADATGSLHAYDTGKKEWLPLPGKYDSIAITGSQLLGVTAKTGTGKTYALELIDAAPSPSPSITPGPTPSVSPSPAPPAASPSGSITSTPSAAPPTSSSTATLSPGASVSPQCIPLMANVAKQEATVKALASTVEGLLKTHGELTTQKMEVEALLIDAKANLTQLSMEVGALGKAKEGMERALAGLEKSEAKLMADAADSAAEGRGIMEQRAHLKAEHQGILTRIEAHDQRRNESEQQAAVIAADIQALQGQQAKAQSDMATTIKVYADRDADLKRLVQDSDQQRSQLLQEVAQLADKKVALTAKMGELMQRVAELGGKKQELERAVDAVTKALALTTGELNSRRLQAEQAEKAMDELRAAVRTSEAQVADLSAKRRDTDLQAYEANAEHARIEARIRELHTVIDRLATTQKEQSQEATLSLERVTTAQAGISALTARQKNLNEAVAALTTHIAETAQQQKAAKFVLDGANNATIVSLVEASGVRQALYKAQQEIYGLRVKGAEIARRKGIAAMVNKTGGEGMLSDSVLRSLGLGDEYATPDVDLSLLPDRIPPVVAPNNAQWGSAGSDSEGNMQRVVRTGPSDEEAEAEVLKQRLALKGEAPPPSNPANGMRFRQLLRGAASSTSSSASSASASGVLDASASGASSSIADAEEDAAEHTQWSSDSASALHRAQSASAAAAAHEARVEQWVTAMVGHSSSSDSDEEEGGEETHAALDRLGAEIESLQARIANGRVGTGSSLAAATGLQSQQASTAKSAAGRAAARNAVSQAAASSTVDDATMRFRFRSLLTKLDGAADADADASASAADGSDALSHDQSFAQADIHADADADSQAGVLADAEAELAAADAQAAEADAEAEMEAEGLHTLDSAAVAAMDAAAEQAAQAALEHTTQEGVHQDAEWPRWLRRFFRRGGGGGGGGGGSRPQQNNWRPAQNNWRPQQNNWQPNRGGGSGGGNRNNWQPSRGGGGNNWRPSRGGGNGSPRTPKQRAAVKAAKAAALASLPAPSISEWVSAAKRGSWSTVGGWVNTMCLLPDGSAWATNPWGQIFHRNSQRSGWDLWSGSLVQISCGDGGRNVFGYNRDGQMYRWEINHWQHYPGWAAHVGIGADGDIWHVGGQGVYRRSGDWWAWFNEKASWISVGSSDSIWLIDRATGWPKRFIPSMKTFARVGDRPIARVGVAPGGKRVGAIATDMRTPLIYDFQADAWEELPRLPNAGLAIMDVTLTEQGLLQIIDAQGHIWSLNVPPAPSPTRTPSPSTSTLPSPSRTPSPSRAAGVSLSPSPSTGSSPAPFSSPLGACVPLSDPDAWVKNIAADPAWEGLGGEDKMTVKQFAVGAGDGSVFAVDAKEGKVWMKAGSDTKAPWKQVGKRGKFSQVTAADATRVVAVTGDNKIFRLNARTGKWHPLPGSAFYVSIGLDGDLWAVREDMTIRRWSSVGGNWKDMPGTALRVAVGDAGNVWATDIEGDVSAWNEKDHKWEPKTGQMRRLAVSPCGKRVIGINSAGIMHVWHAGKKEWRKVPGSAFEVQATDKEIWTMTEQGEISKLLLNDKGPSPTPSNTATRTPSVTPTNSASNTPGATPSPTGTPSVTPTATGTVTPTPTPTTTISASPSLPPCHWPGTRKLHALNVSQSDLETKKVELTEQIPVLKDSIELTKNLVSDTQEKALIIQAAKLTGAEANLALEDRLNMLRDKVIAMREAFDNSTEALQNAKGEIDELTFMSEQFKTREKAAMDRAKAASDEVNKQENTRRDLVGAIAKISEDKLLQEQALKSSIKDSLTHRRSLAKDIGKQQSAKLLASAQVDFLSQRVKGLSAENEALAGAVKDLTATLEKTTRQRDIAADELKGAIARLARAEADMPTVRDQKKAVALVLAKLQHDVHDAQNALAVAQAAVKAANEEVERLNAQRKSLNAAIAELKLKIAANEQALNDLTDQRSRIAIEIDRLEDTRRKKDTQLQRGVRLLSETKSAADRATVRRDKAAENLATMKKKLAAATARILELKKQIGVPLPSPSVAPKPAAGKDKKSGTVPVAAAASTLPRLRQDLEALQRDLAEHHAQTAALNGDADM